VLRWQGGVQQSLLETSFRRSRDISIAEQNGYCLRAAPMYEANHLACIWAGRVVSGLKLKSLSDVNILYLRIPVEVSEQVPHQPDDWRRKLMLWSIQIRKRMLYGACHRCRRLNAHKLYNEPPSVAYPEELQVRSSGIMTWQSKVASCRR
jgi:hypothetical protein